MKANSESNVSIESDKDFDSELFDGKKVYTGVTLFTGKKLETKIDLDKFIKDDSGAEKICLKGGCGVIQTFMLNNVLTIPGFLKG